MPKIENWSRSEHTPHGMLGWYNEAGDELVEVVVRRNGKIAGRPKNPLYKVEILHGEEGSQMSLLTDTATFDSKSDAREYAIKWMRGHPNPLKYY